MSAIMQQRQQIQGIEIGAGLPVAILVMCISLAFVGMNGYHMSNYLIAKLTTLDSSIFVVGWWKVVGFGVAALEIPLGMSFITNYRLYGFWNVGVLTQLALAIIVATLAAGAGIGSQMADAETRANQITSHNTALSANQYAISAAKNNRDKRLLATNRIKNEDSRAIAKLDIKQRYQQEMARITQNTSTQQAKKPLKIMEDGSQFQVAIFALLSIVASVGAFFLSCFHAVYVKQLVALIAFSLKSKANHEWESSAADFKTKKHEISPLNKENTGILFKEKVPAETVTQPRPTASSTTETTDENDKPTHVECKHCQAVFLIDKAHLEPTAKNKNGLIRCGECGGKFVGKDCIVLLNKAQKKQVETGLVEHSKNPENLQIPREFAANSHGILVTNHEDTSLENSTGIHGEFAENSRGIPKGGNSQAFTPEKSGELQHVDLSKVASIDDREEKLKALAETIDTLSSDPQYSGLIFSPTKAKRELHLNYQRIQDVFQAKQKEGKISQTKPYKITFQGA